MKPKANKLTNQKGQTFIEFIFLLIILVTISFTLLRGFRGMVGGRWEVMLKIIAKPNQSEISFP